jgi:hypothetical protein
MPSKLILNGAFFQGMFLIFYFLKNKCYNTNMYNKQNKMRLIILLVPIACGLLATFNLFDSDFFNFFMWSFISIFLFLAILPLVFNSKKEVVPVYQIFFTLITLILLTSVLAYFDIEKLKIPKLQAMVYGGVAGITITSILIALRPK